jgi:hypothetical protein
MSKTVARRQQAGQIANKSRIFGLSAMAKAARFR